MIASTLSAALLAQLPSLVTLPSALDMAQVEVLVQATEDHFHVHNLSPLPQVLVIGDGQFGATGAVRIAPGEQALYPFPRGTADDLLIEVIALDPHSWRNTGALAIETLRACDAGALWIQASLGFSIGWSQENGHLRHTPPQSGLLPAALIAAHPGLQDYRSLASAHVPVPMPVDDKKGTTPPVVEDEVLPPV